MVNLLQPGTNDRLLWTPRYKIGLYKGMQYVVHLLVYQLVKKEKDSSAFKQYKEKF
jgi:hypothetical protein